MQKNEFYQKLQEKGYNISDKQIKQFDLYYHFLVEYNEKVNLTAITKEEEVYAKHFYDSLTLLPIEDNCNLCDVGAGAGFPSIPIKIMNPSINVTIIEPLGKRIVFLERLCQLLDIEVNCVNMRSEEYVVNHREQFDIVTARAVANLNILSELCIPLVKLNGRFIALKGIKAQEELSASDKAIKLLGCELEKIEHISYNNNDRYNLYFMKKSKTDMKYPRNYGAIKKKPL
ncbi:MAG: 16S rRNA (guanine(527)-N(7))-methyltransferase RsmG [Erysipelotrichaceae bacterium]